MCQGAAKIWCKPSPHHEKRILPAPSCCFCRKPRAPCSCDRSQKFLLIYWILSNVICFLLLNEFIARNKRKSQVGYICPQLILINRFIHRFQKVNEVVRRRIRSSHGRIPEYHIAVASAASGASPLALLDEVEASGRSDLWRMSIMCANGMCKQTIQVSRAEAEAGGN